MQKLFGWTLIIFCGTLLLVYAIAAVVVVLNYELIEEFNTKFNVPLPQLIISWLSFLGFIALLVLGFRAGIRKVRKKKVPVRTTFTRRLNITFSGIIAYRDYRNLNLAVSLKKPLYIIAMAIALFMLLAVAANGYKGAADNTPVIIIGAIAALVLLPVSVVMQTKKLYDTNKMFREMLTYTLTNEQVHIKGDTIDSIQKWEHFYRIIETKQFFLLYQSNMIAIMLYKKMMASADCDELRDFIMSLDVIKE